MTAALALLSFLAEWSIRWGLVLGALAVWFALRPPRLAATRHALCLAALAAGLLLPILPRRAAPSITWAAPPPTIQSAPLPADPPPSTITTTAFLPAKDSPAATVVAPPAQPAIPWRVDFLALLVLTLALGWTTGAAYHLARLAAGWLVLARLRRTAVPVDADQAAILADALRSLGLRRRVGLAMHPAVSSPVTLGGFRPLVLVPADWPDWPEPRRRAALLHEFSHLSRRDDWAKLAQELVRAPLFFHPLVLWLLARLDRERELLCDEAVVSFGSDPVDYARLLLDLSLRPCRLLPTGLPFLDRRTVAARIHLLLEDGMDLDLPRPSPRRLLLLGALALSVSLGLGSLRVRSAEPAAQQDAPAPSRSLTGTVVDADGRPVAGATVVAGRLDAGEPNHLIFTTDSRGRFSEPLPPGMDYLTVLAHKTGHAAATTRVSREDKSSDLEARLVLGRLAPYSAALVGPDSKPLAGARVRVQLAASLSVSPGDDDTISNMVCLYRFPEAIYVDTPLESALAATTDARGAFTIPGLPADLWPRFAITSADGREMRLKLAASSRPEDRPLDEGCVPPSREPGNIFHTLPTGRVEGRLVSKVPGISVAGVRVWYGGVPSKDHPLKPTGNLTGGATRTDREGRFAFDGLDDGEINIYSGPDRAAGPATWACRAAERVPVRSGQPRAVTLELVRGIEVAGKVVSRADSRPLADVRIGFYGPARPRSGAECQSTNTDAEGRFRLRVPPGEVYYYVMGPVPGYAITPSQDTSRTVEVPDLAHRFDLPPLELLPALPLAGRLTSPDGSPIPDVRVVAICENDNCAHFSEPETRTDAQGHFRFEEGFQTSIPTGRPARLLIRFPDGSKRQLTALPSPDGNFAAVLPDLPTSAPPE